MEIIILASVFIFGLIIGSFLNCVVYRMSISDGIPRGKAVSFLRGRSFCPHCKHILSWRDLIPLFSFLALRGKCRYCHKKISTQYPLVEIATALLFLLIFNYPARIGYAEGVAGGQFSILNQLSIINFQTVLNLLFLFAIASFLILIFVYDLKHFIIPDKIVYPAIVIAFLYQLFVIFLARRSLGEGGGFGAFAPILNPLVSGFAACLFFLIIFLFSKGRWIGFGDVKLGFLLGLFLGFPKVVVALFISYLIGAIIGLGIIFLKKGTMKTEVPFGPFLIFGTFVALFLGDFLSGWYLKFIL